MKKAIFLDKDGTLIKDVPYNVNPALIQLEPFAAEALQLLQQNGYRLIVVSNQPGIAFSYFSPSALRRAYRYLQTLLQQQGVLLQAFYYCPHHEKGTVATYSKKCYCRKPQPGLLLKAAAELDIDLQSSWMIGDILNDVEAGNRAGCNTILLNNGNETEWLMNDSRRPTHICSDLKMAADFIVEFAKPVLRAEHL
jgi:histidinol-phosphate phosphatase family protein